MHFVVVKVAYDCAAHAVTVQDGKHNTLAQIHLLFKRREFSKRFTQTRFLGGNPRIVVFEVFASRGFLADKVIRGFAPEHALYVRLREMLFQGGRSCSPEYISGGKPF